MYTNKFKVNDDDDGDDGGGDADDGGRGCGSLRCAHLAVTTVFLIIIYFLSGEHLYAERRCCKPDKIK